MLALGFSHPVTYPIPEGITVKMERRRRSLFPAPINSVLARCSCKIRAIDCRSLLSVKGCATPTSRSCKEEEVEPSDVNQQAIVRRRKQRNRRSLKRRNSGWCGCQHRSGKHIYAQVIDDAQGATSAAASTLDKDLRGDPENGAGKDAASAVGKLVAERANQGVESVVFDRGGYLYHGRVKAPAEGAARAACSFDLRGLNHGTRRTSGSQSAR